MDLGLADKVVFVTGGSRGIGRATALRFAGEGAKVAFSYRSDRQQADVTAADIAAAGADARPVFLDLAQPESMVAAVDAICEEWEAIDVFVGGAVKWASSLPRPERRFEDIPATAWRELVRANLEGTIATIQAAVRAMRGRPDARIVLVGSDVARHGFPGSGAYGASKAALGGLVSALVAELGGDILVNIVSPGFTVTERNLERMPQSLRDEVAARTPTGRLSTPDDVARAIVFLASPANGNITGQTLEVTGGR